jgi:hypothetical protein
MRARALLPLVLLSIVVNAGCPGATPPPTTPVGNTGNNTGGPAVQVATLERTPCFGFCPVYKVAVMSDGTVNYEGERFVKLTGPHTGQISADQVNALRQAFETAGYVQFQDSYEQHTVTDLPSVNTSYTKDGNTKSVRHYLGDRTAPEALGKLEDEFDKIIGIETWIGTPEERAAVRDQQRGP